MRPPANVWSMTLNASPPIPVEGGVRILRCAGADVLETSSPMPEDAAERQYFYYAADGSERNLADYRNGNGMIWREPPRLSWRGNEDVFIFCGRKDLEHTRPHRGFLSPLCAREGRNPKPFT